MAAHGQTQATYTHGDRAVDGLLDVTPGTARKWNNLKRHLSFCRVTQDGDDEACLRLFELPTPEQAVAIRKALGLRRKRMVDAAGSAGANLTPLKVGVSASPVRAEAEGGVMAHLRFRKRKTARMPPQQGCGMMGHEHSSLTVTLTSRPQQQYDETKHA